VATTDRTLQILREIHTQKAVSQRTLALTLGIALGLANSLVRRLIRKGYVRVSGVHPNRLRYYLTPRGVAELTKRAADSMENTIHLYTATRDRIGSQLQVLEGRSTDGDGTRIVFYGAGEVAEIAYITLSGSRLRLVGVVDDVKAGGQFFEHRIQPPDALRSDALQHDVVVVTTFKKTAAILDHLATLGVPASRVFQLAETVVECLPDLNLAS